MSISKKNIDEFNGDVKENDGYLYTTNHSLSSELANRRISECVEAHIGDCDTLVDIGCGDGAYTSEIKEKFPNCVMEGFDPASVAIEIAQKKYPNITFRVVNILDASIHQSERHFDVGILRGVLHHLTDQKLAIHNALVLSPKVIIVEPNGNNPILKIIEKLSPYHRLHEEQSFTSLQLQKWVIEAGGKIATKEYIGFVPFFAPTIFAKIIYFFQPFLERVPLVHQFLSAQIVITCTRANGFVK